MNTFDKLDLSSLGLDFFGDFQGSNDDGDEDTLLAQSTKDSREYVRKMYIGYYWPFHREVCFASSNHNLSHNLL